MKLLVVLFLALVSLTFTGFISRIDSNNTREVLRVARKFLPKDPVIIEAGSYNGDDSVRIAKFWLRGKLFSFEPVPELFDQVLQKSHGYSNIRCFQLALSDQNGFSTFFLSKNDGRVVGSSSLLPPKQHLVCDPSISFPSILEVETVTLDEWARQQGVNKVDFLWLDMQGYELNMLKASKLVLEASVIYTEVEFVEAYERQYLYEDIKSWMKENGFQLVATDFDESNIAKEIEHHKYWANALFVKPSFYNPLTILALIKHRLCCLVEVILSNNASLCDGR